MTPRDDIETIIRRWDRYENNRGASGIIDYDCHPDNTPVTPVASRYEALTALLELQRAHQDIDPDLGAVLNAHIVYLRALLGERIPLDEYIPGTQGCGCAGWPTEHLDHVHSRAVERLEHLGIAWNDKTLTALDNTEGRLGPDDARTAIESAAATFESTVRKTCDTSAPFSVSTEIVDIDDYWSFWLDGHGSTARLRINTRHSQFTTVRARQFALHEVLGHALQYASYSERCARADVPWLRLLSVHTPHQVLLEGLAQAMPLFVATDDTELVTRVRLDHYHALVHAELHHRINTGQPVDECVRFARDHVPYWSDQRIGDLLSDRGANPLLRSYLWAYPAGLDWFAALADHGSTVVIQEVLRAAYRDPLTPRQLHALWPDSPTVGGPGRAPVRLREPAIP